jgi:hypothetical protein
MTNDITDRERICTDTQEWLDDIDRDGPGVDVDAAAPGLGPVSAGDDDNPAPRPPPESASPADTADDDMTYHRANDDDRPVHIDSAPVDLDSAAPDPAAGNAGTPAPTERPDPVAPAPADTDTKPTAKPDNAPSPGETTKAAHPPRYNKKLAAGFVVVIVLVTLAVSGALLAMRSGPHTSDPDHTAHPSTQVSVLAAPTTTSAAAAAGQDSPIPYTATSVGCLPGSTAAQSVAGPDSTQAWVCVTGGLIGQYLVLNLGRSMVITAVCITPGWVGADTSGADQWHQHRVLTRLQWSFNDVPPTVVPQDTGSVHGDACKPMPGRGVLASRIIMLVQETARAPADSTPTTSTPAGPGGLVGDVLGPPIPAEPAPTSSTAPLPGMPTDQTHTDPADNTFAVSSVKIFGHPPQ